MKKKDLIEIIATGFYLGSAQVGSYFHLLLCQGGSPLLYFLLISFWFAGSLTGLFMVPAKRAGINFKFLSLFLYALTIFTCEYVEQLAFSSVTSISVLFCAFLFGLFAGWFFRTRVEKFGAREVLLHENNGFILGYAASAGLLFLSCDYANACVLCSGLLLFGFGSLQAEPGKEIQEQ